MLARALSPDVADALRAPARAPAAARTIPGRAATALVAGLLLTLAFRDGGYFAGTVGAAAAVASVGLALLVAHPVARLRLAAAHALPALLALAALAVWTGASARWSPAPDAAALDLRRDVLYVALFGLSLLAAGGARSARLTIELVLAVIVAIVLAGVVSRLHPQLLGLPRGASAVFDTRLGYPLGYWNAFGALAAIGAVLAIGLAADVRGRAAMRACAAAAAPLLVVAIYLSLSRGAWLALAAGVAALLALAPRRLAVVLAGLVIAVAAAAAILGLRAHPELLDGTRRAGPDAAWFSVELALLACAAGAAQTMLNGLDLRVGRRTAAVALGAIAITSSVALVAAGAGRWIQQRYYEFRAPPATLAADGPARLASFGGLRREAYEVALAGFRAQPLRGEGAGAFEARWQRSRTGHLKLRDAHSLVLATMAELGAIGLALLAAFLACVAVALARCRRGRGALRRTPAAAAGAAVVAWLVHACIDWDWEMPALTGCALVLCAALFARAADPLQMRHAGGRAGARDLA